MTVTVKIENEDRLSARLKSTAKTRELSTDKIIARWTLRIHGKIIKSIQSGAKTGRTYKRGNIVHQASAPGEAPATDTGNLVKNIVPDIKKEKGMAVGFIASRSSYAAFLEFGTSVMEARPYMRPAYDEAKPLIIQDIKKAKRRGNT